MSHFSTIKTKLKDRKALLHALMFMGYGVNIDQTMKNPAEHIHEEVVADITASNNIGFRMNKTTGEYELVTDLQTWNEPIPVKRFLDKVSQNYAIEVITMAAQDKGYEIEEQKVLDNGSVEMVVTRWT